MQNNITVGVFTVKNFYVHNNVFYTYGGFGHYIIDFSKYFKKVVLLAHINNTSPPKGCYEVKVKNLEIVSLPVLRHEWEIYYKLPIYIAIAKKHVKRMDLIQARMPDYSGIVGALLAKRNNIPSFNVIIDDWYIQAKNTFFFKAFGLGVLLKAHLYLYDWIERKICSGAIVLAQGSTCYDKHAKHAKKCYLIISSAHQMNDLVKNLSPKFTKKPFKILNVGRLNSVKNQQLIVKTIHTLNSRAERWNFEHVGEGNKKQELKDLVLKFGLEKNIRFHGRIAHGQSLWAFFDDADVFVLSSLSEGTPKVLLEACARGLPVIASNVAGVSSTIEDGVNGLLFDVNDQAELIKKLKIIRKNTKLRNSLRKKGLETASKNTLEFRNKEMISIVSKAFPHLKIKDPLE
jgi:glycosyltransferase involved in cell wall biosynthesis